MAIASNNSEKEVVGGGNALYVGIAPVKVLAVNPTMAELHELGIMVKQEPNYKAMIGEVEKQKVTFWVQHDSPDIKTRVEFLLEDKTRVNRDGDKNQWINNSGKTAWSGEPASTVYDWYKSDGERKAYIGEDSLVEFIAAWANVSSGDDCYLESIAEIAKGNVAELKQLATALAENRVRVLLGVKDGQYQNVYTKFFGRIKPKRDDLFVRSLNGDFGSFNAEYNTDLSLQRYSPNVISPDTDATAEPVAEEAAW